MPRGAAGAGWSTTTRPIIRAASWCSSPRRTRRAGPTSCASTSTRDEFHQAFAFDLLLAPWTAAAYREAVRSTIDALDASAGSLPAWTLNNHDVQRAVTRFGRADAATHGADIDQRARPLPRRRSISTSARGGLVPRRCSCSGCRAACTSTPARSSGCRRCSTCPTRPARTRCSPAPAAPRSAATAAGYRCRGPPMPRPRSASRRRAGPPVAAPAGAVGAWNAADRAHRSGVDARALPARAGAPGGPHPTSRQPASSCCCPTTRTSWPTGAATSSSSSTCPIASRAACRPSSSPAGACWCRRAGIRRPARSLGRRGRVARPLTAQLSRRPVARSNRCSWMVSTARLTRSPICAVACGSTRATTTRSDVAAVFSAADVSTPTASVVT